MTYHQQKGSVSRDIKETEHTLHMYMFQIGEGRPNGNEKSIVYPQNNKPPIMFGRVVAVDWAIRDGLDQNKASIVARGRGFVVGNSMTTHGYFLSLDILFTDERLKGSSLKVLGSYENQTDNSHLAVVGGTGEFAYAQGTVSYKEVSNTGAEIIREVHICVFSRNIPKQPTVTTPAATKEGPLGGNGGNAFDIPNPPQRIESVTIRRGDVIDSFAYSYIDQAGKRQTAGPWGGNGGNPGESILFAPSETLKKVIGTTGEFRGATVVTSLTFVTNVKTYGPYGKEYSVT
ncbi:uncharacterized protein LOC100843926 [Brachypodium distachyon]|uniref:uncharacterized protein LOC100843926 n=1 Tax=Brachypodium distachyon TaxID=15368 RepID=UPI000D0C978F|nr:uncharacterized protein LOC100843926 [Brachypodium distachyon]|eukprot:XP_003561042.2 uncharacterized protein LOC100843926 [Brachypodium distachyon]